MAIYLFFFFEIGKGPHKSACTRQNTLGVTGIGINGEHACLENELFLWAHITHHLVCSRIYFSPPRQ